MKRSLAALAFLLASSSTLAAQGNDPVVLVLNEVRVDEPGLTANEYAELLGGPPGASLGRVTYIVIGDATSGSNSGVIEAVVPLAGSAIGPDGITVIAEPSYTLGAADIVADLNFENGDNVTHMLVSDFTGAEGDDLDTNDDGSLDVTPWAGVFDAVSLLESHPPTNPEDEWGYAASLGFGEVGPDGPLAPGHVFRCVEGPLDWRIGGFATGSSDTPGVLNRFCDPRTTIVCSPPSPNSFSALGGVVGLDGSGSIQRNDNTLVAISVPSAFGVFVQSDGIGAPMTSIFGGELCLTGNLQRLSTTLFPVGSVSRLPLDFADPASVESTTMAGMTLFYQYAHRDTQFPGGGNWTSGLSIQWVP